MMVPTPIMPGAGYAENLYRGQAMAQLRILKQQMQLGGLKIGSRTVVLGEISSSQFGGGDIETTTTTTTTTGTTAATTTTTEATTTTTTTSATTTTTSVTGYYWGIRLISQSQLTIRFHASWGSGEIYEEKTMTLEPSYGGWYETYFMTSGHAEVVFYSTELNTGGVYSLINSGTSNSYGTCPDYSAPYIGYYPHGATEINP